MQYLTMSMKKIIKKNTAIIQYLITALIIACVVLVLYSLISNFKNKTAKTKTAIEEDQMLKDEVNDGVYTSYIRGFSFSYPTNLFIEQDKVGFNNDNKAENVCWYNEKNVQGGPLGLNQETGIFLCILAYKGSDAQTRFDNEYNSDPKNSPGLGVREIKRFQTDSYKQYILFAKTPEGRETEHSVSYQAGWLTNDGLYLNIFIAAGENKDKLLSKYKKNFDEIVKSVKFFD